MAQQTNSTNTGDAVILRNIDGSIIPGLCIKNITYTEGNRSEKESTCSGKKEAMTRYGVHQVVTAEAVIRGDFYKDVTPDIFVQGEFIDFTYDPVDDHYLALMATTDAATPLATDSFEVISTSATIAEEEDWTFSVTFHRDPDFQPAP